MPRPKRKNLTGEQADAVDQTPAAPESAEPPAPADQNPIPAAPAPAVQAQEVKDSRGQEVDEEKKYPDPRGWHIIDLQDGRHLRYMRSNAMQQDRILFLPDNEQVDPRPSEKDRQFMKERGFYWRAADKAWERQFFSAEDKANIADVKEEEGEDAAKRLRSRIRSESEQVAHDTFIEVANRILKRNGKLPTDFTFGDQEQDRGAQL